jgi:uncharacterized protein YoxC
MFDLEHFELRKKELIDRFNAAANDIKGHQKTIEQIVVLQSELRGAYAECEENIKKLTGVTNGEVDGERTQENQV